MARVGQVHSGDSVPSEERVEEFAREAERVADRSIGAVRDATARGVEAGERSARELADFGSAFGALWTEQTQHGLQAGIALARATDWPEIVRAQRDFLDGTLARSRKFGERYFAAVRALTSSGLAPMAKAAAIAPPPLAPPKMSKPIFASRNAL